MEGERELTRSRAIPGNAIARLPTTTLPVPYLIRPLLRGPGPSSLDRPLSLLVQGPRRGRVRVPLPPPPQPGGGGGGGEEGEGGDVRGWRPRRHSAALHRRLHQARRRADFRKGVAPLSAQHIPGKTLHRFQGRRRAVSRAHSAPTLRPFRAPRARPRRGGRPVRGARGEDVGGERGGAAATRRPAAARRLLFLSCCPAPAVVLLFLSCCPAPAVVLLFLSCCPAPAVVLLFLSC
eukprot:gene2076-biopygen512